jgi:dihydrolipoamide dehydrogenase
MEQEFDLVVIGGGPGGYVAAIRAAQLKMKVAVVEREHLGGICLNWGCIPTKALLKSADVLRTIQHSEEFGISTGNVKIDFKKIVARSRAVSAKLAQGVQMLMKKHKITVIEGSGFLQGRGKVAVIKNNQQIANLSAKNIIIATGARPRILKGLEPDGKNIWTYREAMVAEELPARLLVIGSGAIGAEFASFYQALGSSVTLVEVQDRILPIEDAEISKQVQKSFVAQGINVKVSTIVEALKVNENQVSARFVSADKKTAEEIFDRVIVAVGIVGNTENIGLENTRVQVDKNQVVTDIWCETHEKGVYAIGDVAGAPWLAHKASHEAIICVEKIAGIADVHALNKENIPGCTYAHPQVASVGLTEASAKEKGYAIKVGRFQGVGNGKAIALGEEKEAFVKVIFDANSGALLGAHMVGPEVTEMIQGFVVGKTLEATEAEFMHSIFPHPTVSEMMHEAVLDAFGRALHA